MKSFERILPGDHGIVWVHVFNDWSGDAEVVFVSGPNNRDVRRSATIETKRLLVGDIGEHMDLPAMQNLATLPLFVWCAAVSLAVEARMFERAIEIIEGGLFLSSATRPR